MIQQIINIFSSSKILSFFSAYVATKALDKCYNSLVQDSIEEQLIDALDESLNKFCESMNWEYDMNAITETFVVSVASLNGITSKSALKKVLENATQCDVTDEQINVWISHFCSSVSSTSHSELRNYLLIQHLFNASSIIDFSPEAIENAGKADNEKTDCNNRENSPLHNVSIITSIYNSLQSSNSTNEQDVTLEYVYSKTNGILKIEPTMDYLRNLQSNGAITPLSFTHHPFNWDFPCLDFKITNNSDMIVYITDVVFKNICSIIDPRPIVFIRNQDSNSNARHIQIFNDGWGKIKNLKIRLSACPINSDEKVDHYHSKYSHELFIGDIETSINVDISSVLRDYKYIPPTTYSEKDSANSLHYDRFDYTKVFGELIFDGDTYDHKTMSYSVKFETIVYLYEWEAVGAPAPPTYCYTAKFETNYSNYTVTKSVSHVLNPKECDRFLVSIGMDKSSYHEFDIDVVTNLGTLTLPKVQLLSFVPRLGSEYIDE